MKRSLPLWALLVSVLITSPSHAHPNPHRDIVSKLSTITIPFIENVGQMERRVSFYARTFGGTVFVTRDGSMVYAFSTGGGKGHPVCVIKEELLGKEKERRIRGTEPSTCRVNLFIGKDPKGWFKNIRTYNEISLGEVYPGIELRLRAYGRKVEKIFHISPGADPSRIKLLIDGATSLGVTKRGELEAKTPHGSILFSRPKAWQYLNGKRVTVDVSYRVLSSSEEKHTYTFSIGSYDRTRPLFIDPIVRSTYLGGGDLDLLFAIAISPSRDEYLAA